jgi:Zn-dependent M28 family amino/carboxypeptidase
MARVLKADPVPYTVWLAFLDGEAAHAEDSQPDQRFLGSRALVNEIQETGALSRTRLMLYFNQVADRDLMIARDLRSERVIRKSFQSAARELGYGAVFSGDRPFSRPPGGHSAFLAIGFRRVMIFSDDRFGGDEAPGVYWQTEDDTLEQCDPQSLAIVGQVTDAGLRKVVARFQKVDRFSRRPVPATEAEPVEADPAPELEAVEGEPAQ